VVGGAVVGAAVVVAGTLVSVITSPEDSGPSGSRVVLGAESSSPPHAASATAARESAPTSRRGEEEGSRCMVVCGLVQPPARSQSSTLTSTKGVGSVASYRALLPTVADDATDPTPFVVRRDR
jgi:hypothetical protein